MSDIFATTDGLILNIYYLHFLSSSITEPIMKQKKRSSFFDEQYNLRISTSSLKKGEKNSLQKKDKSNYSCMYVWKEVVLATQCSQKGKTFHIF